jgi:hypothetical protein
VGFYGSRPRAWSAVMSHYATDCALYAESSCLTSCTRLLSCFAAREMWLLSRSSFKGIDELALHLVVLRLAVHLVTTADAKRMKNWPVQARAVVGVQCRRK